MQEKMAIKNCNTKIRKAKPFWKGLAFLIVLFFFTISPPVFASPPGSAYTPGETLNPSCSPGDTNCSVVQITIATTSNNFGIGTTSPYAKLSVSGQIVGASFVSTTTATSTFAGGLTVANTGSTGLTVLQNGNVGIATSSPSSMLSIGLSSTQAGLFIGHDGSSTPAFYVGSANQNGFVGIGTSTQQNPTDKLILSGGSFFQSVASTTGSGASDQTGMRVVGSFAIASALDVALVDNYIYVFDTSSLNIIDVSNPSAPQLTSTLVIPVGVKLALKVVGNYAYVLGTTNDYIVDISNKSSPYIVSRFGSGFLSGTFRGFDISGKYAYLGSSVSKFAVADISNPQDPRIIATGVTISETGLRELVVSGKYAYIGGLQNIFEVIDISNPSVPKSVASTTLTTSGGILSIQISGNYAYVTDATSLRILNISNPNSVQQVGSINVDSGASALHSLSVQGRYVYAQGASQITVIDVASSTKPVNVASFPSGGSVLKVAGRYAYSFTGAVMNVIDISGIEVQSAIIHSLEAGSLMTRESASIGGALSVSGSATFGSGLLSQGPVGFSLASTTSLSGINVLSAGISDTNNSSIVDIANLFHTASSSNGSTYPSAGIGAGLLFSSADASWSATSTSRIASILTNVSTTSPASALTFSNKNTAGSLTEFMRLDSNGNLGIGTTSPYAKLSVVGEVVARNFTATSTTATSTFFGGLSVANTGSTGLTILQNGNVGIATSSPSSMLSIGLSSTQAGLFIGHDGSSTPAFYVGSANQNGFVGIGTSTQQNPTDKLILSGGSFFQSVASTTGSGASDQTGMRIMSSLPIGTTPAQVVVSGPYAYVIDSGSDDLKIIDVSNPNSPQTISSKAIGSVPVSVFVSGHYAYVIDSGSDDLKIIDVSNPGSPQIVSSFALSTSNINPIALFVSGRYAYVTDNGSADLKIIDISNPNSPQTISSLALGAIIGGSIVVSGQYLYIVDSASDTFRTIDVSNPISPQIVGTLAVGAGPTGLAVSGRYAYVLDGTSDDLKIIDTATSSAPVLKGSISIGPLPASISISGRYAYVSDLTSDDLKVIDVANPSSPKILASIPLGPVSGSVFVSGRYVYVIDNSSDDLKIVDISGIEVQSAIIHSLEAGSLSIRKNASIDGLLSVSGSATFGSGLLSQGPVGFSLASTTSLSGVTALSAGISDTNNSSIVDIANLFHTSTTSVGATFPSAGIGAGLLFSLADASWSATSTSRIASILTNVSITSPASALTFSNKNTAGSLTEFMRLDSTGKLGIGTTSPYAKLSVVGEVVGANFTATSTIATSTFYGSVSIGSSTPSARLSISQTADTRGGGIWQSATDGDYRATYMDTTGVLNFNGGDGGTLNTASLNAAGAWTNASDRSYKENIVDLNTKYNLNTILSLNPRFYTMKGSGLPQIGFIAQEVNDLVPEVVDGVEGSLGISYGNLATLSFQGIKDLANVLNIQTSSTTNSFTSVRLDEIERKIIELQNTQPESFSQNVIATIRDLILNSITAISAKFTDLVSEKIVVENLIVGSQDKPAGIIMFSKSGKAFCLVVDDEGVPTSTLGKCDTISNEVPTTTPQVIQTDKVPPTITIIGNNPAEIEKGTPYVDLGATVDDNVDHNLGITTSGLEIDTTILGTYTVTYTATDNSGNTASTTRTVIVKEFGHAIPVSLPINDNNATTTQM